MRKLSNSVVIFLGMLVLCAIPAHGQIVSYLDSGGKRVFINADPPHIAAQAKGSQSKTSGVPGLTKIAFHSTDHSFFPAPELSAAAIASREKIEQMIHEVSARYRVMLRWFARSSKRNHTII